MTAAARLRKLSALLALMAVSFFPHAAAQSSSPADGARLRPGATVPLDLRLVDESGEPVRLGSLLTRPTILLFAEYRGNKEGPKSLAVTLGAFDMVPGRDYGIISVDSDPTATSADAAAAKSAAIAAIGKPFPATAWRFLVGGRAEIGTLMEDIGLGQGAASPGGGSGLVVLSPTGKIVRYLPGAAALPLDLGMSLMAASPGLLRPAAASVLRFCLRYDAVDRHYTLDIPRMSGIVIFALAALLALFLLLSSGRRRRRTRVGV